MTLDISAHTKLPIQVNCRLGRVTIDIPLEVVSKNGAANREEHIGSLWNFISNGGQKNLTSSYQEFCSAVLNMFIEEALRDPQDNREIFIQRLAGTIKVPGWDTIIDPKSKAQNLMMPCEPRYLEFEKGDDVNLVLKLKDGALSLPSHDMLELVQFAIQSSDLVLKDPRPMLIESLKSLQIVTTPDLKRRYVYE